MPRLQGFLDDGYEQYVYQETNAGTSIALGIDSVGDTFNLSVLTTPDAHPSDFPVIQIYPAGDLVFIPVGVFSLIGDMTGTNNITLISTTASSSANSFILEKSRSGSTIVSGDTLGTLNWSGHDGTQYITASQIKSVNSGTVAANRIASNLLFYTHPDSTTASTLRMTIAPAGNVTIATPDSGTALTISGGGIISTGTTTLSSLSAGVMQTDSSGVVSSSNGTNGQLLIGGGTAPAWASLTSTGSTITITPGANTINLEASSSGSLANIFHTGSGDATVASGAITMAGGSNLSSTGSGSTVTYALVSSPSVSGSLTAGTSITATAGNINLTSSSYSIVLPALSGSQIKISTDTLLRNKGGEAYGAEYQSLFFGYNAGNASVNTHCSSNVGVGTRALESATGCQENFAMGYRTLGALTGNDNSGYRNVAIGNYALYQLVGGNGVPDNGSYNTCIGYGAGSTYTGNEYSNILINCPGVAGQNNRLQIGTSTGTGAGSGKIGTAFICGIYNIAVGATAGVVIADSSNQIGSISGSANTVLVGGTKPSFTDSPSVSGSLTAGTSITATAGNIVTTNGSVVIGATAAATTAQDVDFKKSRSGAVITSGDTLGTITFQGHDGTGYITASQIRSVNSGTVATNRIASNLLFYTHPDSTTSSTLRMTIDTTGAVTIAAPDSGTGLTISGGGITIGAGGITFTSTGTNGITSIDTFGRTVGVSGVPVVVDNTGLFGTIASSKRFKHDIVDMADSSDVIMKLRPVMFTYNNNKEAIRSPGLIAEEVADVIPDLVSYDQDGLPYTVKYNDLPAMLLNEIQKLRKRIEFLEAKNGI